ncbi:MAG: hypothetical protein AAGA56_21170 [Myxococcota bacterium]
MWRGWWILGVGTTMVVGCASDPPPPSFEVVARAPTDRTPRPSGCDPLDDTRCLLPYPSSAFLEEDPATATGVRLQFELTSLNVDDDPTPLHTADGFSRLGAIMFGAEGLLESVEPIDVRLWNAEPSHPGYGERIPLSLGVVSDDISGRFQSLVMGYPERPMAASAQHVALVFAGEGLVANRMTEVALARVAPASEDEARTAGYFAPVRAFLREQEVDFARIARVWDFVTRSEGDARLEQQRVRDATVAAVDGGRANVVIDRFEVDEVPAGAAAIVRGRLVDLPSFVGQADGEEASGTIDAPFRIVIPEGDGDYPWTLFGHGLGGEFDDRSFDDFLLGEGMAKVGIEIHGWTGDTFLDTFGGILNPVEGIVEASSLLRQAVADAAALQRALHTELGDVLAAPQVNGVDNPAAGRRPRVDIAAWAGGSLGGSVGLTYAYLEDVDYAVLNVPGAGWSRFIYNSQFFGALDALLAIEVGGSINVAMIVMASQPLWDGVDGALWVEARPDDESPVCLVQQSVGDPVVPSVATELVAVATEAVFVGEPVAPFAALTEQDVAREQTAITQYVVNSDDQATIHGFAAESIPSGEAARAQMRHFLRTALLGQAEIVVPDACDGRCDFTE